MSSSCVKSTALVPYVSSKLAYFWSQNPESVQEYMIRKSFSAQVADYNLFHCGEMSDLIRRLPVTSVIQCSTKPYHSLIDCAIAEAKNIAHAQLFLKAIRRSFRHLSQVLDLAFQRNTFFLDKAISRIQSSSPETLQDKKKEITDLFFRILPRYKYDRSLITQGSVLEFILDKDVSQSHDQLDEVDPVSGKKIHETIAEVLFARRLGIKLEKAYSQYHSVYYLLDRSNQRLGIFKPPVHIEALEDRYGSSEDREGHLAEAASSVVDRFLRTKVVPYTQLLAYTFSLSKKAAPVIGSFQFYVNGGEELDRQLEGENLFDPNHKELSLRLDNTENRQLEFRNLEEFALFDLLTGNNDHHFKNILLKKVAEKVWNLVAIDNANSFPWCHDIDLPPYKMHPNHWFKWSTLPQAEIPFSDSMIDEINRVDIDRLEDIARNELVNQSVPSSEGHIEGKIKTMRDRFDRIKLLANQRVTLRGIAKEVLTLTCQKNG